MPTHAFPSADHAPCMSMLISLDINSLSMENEFLFGLFSGGGGWRHALM